MQFWSTNAQIKCAKKIKISACQSKFTYYIVWAALTVCQHLLATWQSWNAATMTYRNLKYVHHQTVLYVFGFQGCWSIPNTKFSFLFFLFWDNSFLCDRHKRERNKERQSSVILWEEWKNIYLMGTYFYLYILRECFLNQVFQWMSLC